MAKKSETRRMRPYVEAVHFEGLLAPVSAAWFNGTARPLLSANSSALLEVEDPRVQWVDLSLDAPEWSSVPERAARANLDLSLLSLVVFAVPGTLKVAERLLEVPLTQWDSPLFGRKFRAVAPQAFSDRVQLRIAVAIVLNSARDASPPQARLAGTWLDYVDFVWRAPNRPFSFDPKPLTDEVREQFKLPHGSLTFADLRDSALQAKDAIRDIYIDAPLLRFFADNEEPATELVGSLLLGELLSQVMIGAYKDLAAEREELAEGSLYDHLQKEALKATGLRSDELERLLRDSDGLAWGSLVQTVIKARSLAAAWQRT